MSNEVIKIKEMQELVNPDAAPAERVYDTFYPKTHEKAVVDDEGNTLFQKFGLLKEEVRDMITEGENDINEAISEFAPVQITGDVTNAADEEDLTSVNVGGTDVIKFKDKAYLPAQFSGMGRVYLRKNMVDVSGTMKNVLTQDMLYKGEVGSRVPNTNTIFVIQYDYELASNVTVPDGCVLEFDGGSIGGEYTLTFNDTTIKGDAKLYITPAGTINGTVNVAWFGLVSNDDSFDNSAIFNKVGRVFSNVYVPKGVFSCSSPINWDNNVLKELVVDGDIKYVTTDTDYRFLTLKCVSAVIRLNGQVFGPNSNISDSDTTELSVGICIRDCNNSDILINRIQFFHTNIEFLGSSDGLGCSYNKVTILFSLSAKVLLRFNSESGGWVTTNKITINRLTNFGGQTEPDAGILFKGNAYNTNGHEFSDIVIDKVSIEGLTKNPPIQIYNGWKIKILNVRNESNHRNLVFLHHCDNIECTSNYSAVKVLSDDVSNIHGDRTYRLSVSPYEGSFKKGSTTYLPDAISYSLTHIFSSTPLFYLPCYYVFKAENLDGVPINVQANSAFTLHIKFIDAENNALTYEQSSDNVTFGLAKQKATVDDSITTSSKAYSHSLIYSKPSDAVYIAIGFRTENSGTSLLMGAFKPVFTFVSDENLISAIATEFHPSLSSYRFVDYMSGTTPPSDLDTNTVGYAFFNTSNNKPNWWKGAKFIEADNATAGVLRSGTFANKPAAADIYVGYRYFCTDRQTTEGATDGIEIIHKGNDVWVDALGRVVS